jgi:hypothetical protein
MHAHGMRELRSYDNPLYKVQMCSSLKKKGYCRLRDDCMYAHTLSELRSTVFNEIPNKSDQEILSSSENSESETGVVSPVSDGDVKMTVDRCGGLDPKYKTKLCLRYEQTQFCIEGESCPFAHGEAELRYDASASPPVIKPGLFKTSLCKNYITLGVCPAGNKCSFAHGKYELRPVGFKGDFQKKITENSKWKCTLCKSFNSLGKCERFNCEFAHGVHELRSEFPDKPDQFQRFNYKTTLCIHYEEDGHCNLGADCKFAHGVHELRTFKPIVTTDIKPSVTMPRRPAVVLTPRPPPTRMLDSPPCDDRLFLEFLEFKKFKQQFLASCTVSVKESHERRMNSCPKDDGLVSMIPRGDDDVESAHSLGSSESSDNIFQVDSSFRVGSAIDNGTPWPVSDSGYYSRSASQFSPETALRVSLPVSPFAGSACSPSNSI